MSLDIYVKPQEDSQVKPPEDSLPSAKYARVPWDIITSKSLKRLDGYVYAVLSASVWQGNYASVGTRRIAEVLHTTQRRVVESLARLIADGKIAAAPRTRGQRSAYVLTSPVFGQKPRAGVEEVQVYGPLSAPRKRLVSVRAA